jgi:ribonuclease HII
VTRHSLDDLRQRYVTEGRPLEARLEEILRADTRAGARAILASIAKRRFENRSEGQRLRKMLGAGPGNLNKTISGISA